MHCITPSNHLPVPPGYSVGIEEAGEAAAPAEKDATPNKTPRGAGSEPAITPALAPARLPAKTGLAAVPAIAAKTTDRAADATPKKDSRKSEAEPADDGGSAQVVSLDSFRKKT